MTPVALPFFVIRRHDSSVDASPLSSEKTREANLLLKRKPRHELSCNGKAVANVCKNSLSEIWNVAVLAVLRWKVREATSAIRLLSPAMDTEINGDASLAWMRMARARVSRPAICEREELSLLVQLTVGVLSHHAATCTCLRSTRCSSTKYCTSIAAISRSELVMVPPGFANETTLWRMSSGHSRRHTMGPNCSVPDSHTPPAPSVDASQ